MNTKKFLFVVVTVMSMASLGVVAMAGEGSSDADWNDPSEYYAALQREASRGAASNDVPWDDPSEYYAALQREASAAATKEAIWSFAGSYGALRLAAGDTGTGAVSAGNWNDPSEYYAALQREARAAAVANQACEVC